MKKQLLILALCASVLSAHAATSDRSSGLSASLWAEWQRSESATLVPLLDKPFLLKKLEAAATRCLAADREVDSVARKTCFQKNVVLFLGVIDANIIQATKQSHALFRSYMGFKFLGLYFLGRVEDLKKLRNRFSCYRDLSRTDCRYSSYQDFFRMAEVLIRLTSLKPGKYDSVLSKTTNDPSRLKTPWELFIFNEYQRKSGRGELVSSCSLVGRLAAIYADIANYDAALDLLVEPVVPVEEKPDLTRVMSSETLRAVSPERTGGSSVDLLSGGTVDEEVSSPKRQRRREPIVASSVLDDMPRDLSALDVPADLKDLLVGF